jgi:PIN domain nuclease of toxin-antitoxin system
MKILLDTHLLLWAAIEPEKLSSRAMAYLGNEANHLIFSAASIWEVAVKRGLDRPDFRVEPALLRGGLLDAGYEEMGILSRHAVEVAALPPLHKDPFDRMLLAQANCEGCLFLTADQQLLAYPGPVTAV